MNGQAGNSEEFKVHTFAFTDSKHVGPHNVDAWVESTIKRNKILETLFNDGWRVREQIVCPPSVMLILGRIKKEAE